MTASPLSQLVTPFAFDAHISGLGWIGDTAAFALADGVVALVGEGGAVTKAAAHPEAGLLAATGNGRVFITSGDDGRVVRIEANGTVTTLREAKGAWIDALAVNAEGCFAYGAGKRAVFVDTRGQEKTFDAPSTVRGLAFAPKGLRLAAAHYNGASLWFPNVVAEAEFLEWKGSHLDIIWSPDGRFVVSSMQENALHGWRLQPDRGHMRMAGYPAKTRSFSWTNDGKWLATSGADAVVLWPFDSKEGPIGKAPRECGAHSARVTQVAAHPKSPVLAAGYEDGTVLLIRLTDASELTVREKVSGSAVTGLVWDEAGRKLLFGCADGATGLLVLP